MSLYNHIPRSPSFLTAKKDTVILCMQKVRLQKLWVGGLYLKATFYSQVKKEFTVEVKS